MGTVIHITKFNNIIVGNYFVTNIKVDYTGLLVKVDENLPSKIILTGDHEKRYILSKIASRNGWGIIESLPARKPRSFTRQEG